MAYEHELSNYRISLKAWNKGWSKATEAKQKKMWNRVLGNALRLAEAVDRTESKEASKQQFKDTSKD